MKIINSKSISSAAIASLLLFGSASLFSSASSAKVCKDELVHVSVGTIKKNVKRRVERQWERKAKNKHGRKFKKWSNAKNKDIKCNNTYDEWAKVKNRETQALGNAFVGNRCAAIAKPCKK